MPFGRNNAKLYFASTCNKRKAVTQLSPDLSIIQKFSPWLFQSVSQIKNTPGGIFCKSTILKRGNNEASLRNGRRMIAELFIYNQPWATNIKKRKKRKEIIGYPNIRRIEKLSIDSNIFELATVELIKLMDTSTVNFSISISRIDNRWINQIDA